MRIRRQLCLVTLVALATSTGLANLTRAADDPLRWKFKVGEKLDYKMVQEMNMAASGGPIPQMKTTMHQEMDMTWDVQGVNDEGEAVIRQKFDRIKMKMTTPVGGFEYDSNAEAAPTGLGAMIAPMYKAMTQGEFEITMTARGEVKDVKVPEEVLTALKSSPGAAAMGDMATAEGFKKMISQGALVLPENPPKEGESWSSKVEMNNPAAGKQTVETTYTYQGTKEIDGTTYAVIKPELKMEFEQQPAEGEKSDAEKAEEPKQPAPIQQLQMKVGEQSSDGEVLFNIKEGRLYSTTLNQKVTIDATVQGQVMQQKIDQKIDVKVTPSGEEKPEEKAPEAEAKKADPSDEKSK
jgi:hypothetical protein